MAEAERSNAGSFNTLPNVCHVYMESGHLVALTFNAPFQLKRRNACKQCKAWLKVFAMTSKRCTTPQ
eukprot:5490668-Amphidinium_carterae.1